MNRSQVYPPHCLPPAPQQSRHAQLWVSQETQISSWIVDSISRRVKKEKKLQATSHEEDATLPRALGDTNTVYYCANVTLCPYRDQII